MGFELAKNLQQHFSKFYKTAKFKHIGFERTNKITPKKYLITSTSEDQRDVIITRNIYAAIASGYLYHKKGKECYLHPNYDDRPWPVTWPKVHNLHNFWEYTSLPTIDPPHGRENLCIYLANNTMEDGLKVYIDWVFSVYYDVVDEWDGDASKTLYVCFDDLTNEGKDQDSLQKIEHFFFPMRDVLHYSGWRPGAQAYDGEHSTSSDPRLRGKINEIAKELDQMVFGGKLAAFQKRYPCGGN
jgi:hypothetical protein